MGQPGLCFLHCFCLTIDHWSPPVQPRCTRSNTEGRLCIMPEKKVSTPAADAPAAEGKTRKSTKAPARRGRPPLAPELYVEMGGEQYNITHHPQGRRTVLQGVRQARRRRSLLRHQ